MSSNQWTHVRVRGSMGHSPNPSHGLLNKTHTEGRVVSLNSLVAGPEIKAKKSLLHQTPLPYNDYRTSGHRSTTTLMNNSRDTNIVSTQDICLDKYQMAALAGFHLLFNSRATLLCPYNIRNTKIYRGYHWISMPSLLGKKLMGYPSRGMIS